MEDVTSQTNCIINEKLSPHTLRRSASIIRNAHKAIAMKSTTLNPTRKGGRNNYVNYQNNNKSRKKSTKQPTNSRINSIPRISVGKSYNLPLRKSTQYEKTKSKSTLAKHSPKTYELLARLGSRPHVSQRVINSSPQTIPLLATPLPQTRPYLFSHSHSLPHVFETSRLVFPRNPVKPPPARDQDHNDSTSTSARSDDAKSLPPTTAQSTHNPNDNFSAFVIRLLQSVRDSVSHPITEIDCREDSIHSFCSVVKALSSYILFDATNFTAENGSLGGVNRPEVKRSILTSGLFPPSISDMLYEAIILSLDIQIIAQEGTIPENNGEDNDGDDGNQAINATMEDSSFEQNDEPIFPTVHPERQRLIDQKVQNDRVALNKEIAEFWFGGKLDPRMLNLVNPLIFGWEVVARFSETTPIHTVLEFSVILETLTRQIINKSITNAYEERLSTNPNNFSDIEVVILPKHIYLALEQTVQGLGIISKLYEFYFDAPKVHSLFDICMKKLADTHAESTKPILPLVFGTDDVPRIERAKKSIFGQFELEEEDYKLIYSWKYNPCNTTTYWLPFTMCYLSNSNRDTKTAAYYTFMQCSCGRIECPCENHYETNVQQTTLSSDPKRKYHNHPHWQYLLYDAIFADDLEEIVKYVEVPMKPVIVMRFWDTFKQNTNLSTAKLTSIHISFDEDSKMLARVNSIVRPETFTMVEDCIPPLLFSDILFGPEIRANPNFSKIVVCSRPLREGLVEYYQNILSGTRGSNKRYQELRLELGELSRLVDTMEQQLVKPSFIIIGEKVENATPNDNTHHNTSQYQNNNGDNVIVTAVFIVGISKLTSGLVGVTTALKLQGSSDKPN